MYFDITWKINTGHITKYKAPQVLINNSIDEGCKQDNATAADDKV